MSIIIETYFDAIKRLKENIATISPEERLFLLKESGVEFVLACMLKTENREVIDLTENEYEYFKKYFLKYSIRTALELYAGAEDKFTDEEKNYLFACCLENPGMAFTRLKYNLESDQNNIDTFLNVILSPTVIDPDTITKLTAIQNDKLQERLALRVAVGTEAYKVIVGYYNRLTYTSQLSKNIFYDNLFNKKFIKNIIEREYFLKLDENEKVTLHDLYYEEIKKLFIRSSNKNKQKYIKEYKFQLFESESFEDIKKYYKNDQGSVAKTNYLFTERTAKYAESMEVAKKIQAQ